MSNENLKTLRFIVLKFQLTNMSSYINAFLANNMPAKSVYLLYKKNEE